MVPSIQWRSCCGYVSSIQFVHQLLCVEWILLAFILDICTQFGTSSPVLVPGCSSSSPCCALQDESPVGAAWLNHEWFLEHLSLGQIRGMLRSRGLSAQGDKATCTSRLLNHDEVKRALPQIAATLGLMGTILHLRLVIIGRLPDENYASGGQRTARASSSETSDPPLYSLSRIGSLTPARAAEPATNKNKRPEGNMAAASSQPAGKKAKHASSQSTSHQAPAPATNAAVASGVGYGSGADGSYSDMVHSLSSIMETAWSEMPGFMGGMPGMMGGQLASMLPLPTSMLPPPPDMLPPGVPVPAPTAGQPQHAPAMTKSAVASGVGYGGAKHGATSHDLYKRYKECKKQKQQQQQGQQQQEQKRHQIRQQQEQGQKEKALCLRAILRLLNASCTNPVTVRLNYSINAIVPAHT